jgi:N-acetylglucosamine-6-phosphate deacetylase
VGAETKTFQIQGRHISVIPGIRGDKIVDEQGRLAGAHLDMAGAVRNAVNMLGLELVSALRMASTNPAAFLKLGDRVGRIAPGQRADLVMLDDDLNVQQTWIQGRPALERQPRQTLPA